MSVVYNPFDPAFIANPYPVFKELRAEDPCHQIIGADGVVLLTRYDDIERFLHDRARFSVDHRNLKLGPEQDLEYEDISVILFRDPPQHTKWRQQLAKGLTPAHIEAYRPRLTQLIDEHLDVLEEKGQADFLGDVATPIPFQAICELLGIPVQDWAQVHAWVSDIVNLTEPVASPEVTSAIVRSRDEMRAYLRDVCAHKRANPGNDVISRLLTVTTGGFTEEELVNHVMLLNVSAPEPTASHLAYGILELTRHPEQAADLRDDPDLDRNAVEELLRYEAPLQITGRYPLEDIELHGRTINAGTAVVMSLASANHDPDKWGPTADELNLRRPRANEHLCFARGIHTCFGAALARMHGQLTFGRVVRRFPNLALVEEPTWNTLLNRRGPTQVQVSVR
ncbi:cytochrome P450 [Amorphoplanes nipponensis]|uniref:Cytochrome P450 n=1 Tax=Actinoplanes nipponensis TaxID=135950 RepID=A0A919MJE2_9ACTN|nr:cytochrome P450 [Actinoplanes nipponensis]GIE51724.1 cytochrome P450 [Actinoplanes nipponensis]